MKTQNRKNIVIVGAGVMGSCISTALIGSDILQSLTIVDSDSTKLKALKKKHKTISISTDVSPTLAKADILILAVKPQSFPQVVESIVGKINADTLVISIMAGQSIKNITKYLKIKRVVRAMPNLGARNLESMTVWTGTPALTSSDNKFASSLFSLLGKSMHAKNEDLVDKATAVSASGPGFLLAIVEAYIQEAHKLGFSREEAKMLTLQTFKATNTLLQKEGADPAVLRAEITSKKGTTEAGLAILMGKDLNTLLKTTLAKAYKRAKELSKSK